MKQEREIPRHLEEAPRREGRGTLSQLEVYRLFREPCRPVRTIRDGYGQWKGRWIAGSRVEEVDETGPTDGEAGAGAFRRGRGRVSLLDWGKQPLPGPQVELRAFPLFGIDGINLRSHWVKVDTGGKLGCIVPTWQPPAAAGAAEEALASSSRSTRGMQLSQSNM